MSHTRKDEDSVEGSAPSISEEDSLEGSAPTISEEDSLGGSTPTISEEDSLEDTLEVGNESAEAQTGFLADFELIKELSDGASGRADLYKYVGEDASIKSLLDEKGQLVVKQVKLVTGEEWKLSDKDKLQNANAIKAFNQEVKIIGSLIQNNNNPDLLRPKVELYTDSDDQSIYILNECIANEKGKSKTLGGYLSGMGVAARYESEESFDLAAELNAMGNLFLGMRDAIDQFHQQGFLHLDAGCRNFMIAENNTIKLIDFGMSVNLTDPVTGLSAENPGFVNLPYSLHNKAALRSKARQYGVNTDLFALKVAMIEGLGEYMGLEVGTPNALKTVHGKMSDETAGKHMVRLGQMDDGKRIEYSFNNLMKHAENCPTPDGKVVVSMLNNLKPYLTTYNADMKGNVAEYAEGDRKLFENCIVLKQQKQQRNMQARGYVNVEKRAESNKVRSRSASLPSGLNKEAVAKPKTVPGKMRSSS